MPTTREQSVTLIKAEFGGMLALLGLSASDNPAGLGGVIDNAMLTLGVLPADLATATIADAAYGDYRALLGYFTLSRLVMLASSSVDTVIDGIPVKNSQLFKNLQSLFALYQSMVTDRGLIGTLKKQTSFRMQNIPTW